jgi:hypothetical protein
MKNVKSSFLALLVGTCSFNAMSVAVTSHRLFLEPGKRFTEMMVYNTENEEKVCTITLKPLSLSNTGLVLDKNIEPLPSPQKLVRLSPQRFELGIKQSQAFKVIYRRAPGIDAGEYIGAVAIKCLPKVVDTSQQAAIIPALVHNIPLIVRTDKLNVKGEFKLVERDVNRVRMQFGLTGSRSVTGDFLIFEKGTKKVIAEKKNVSVYPQWSHRELTIDLPQGFDDDVTVAFYEAEVSGDLKVESE